MLVPEIALTPQTVGRFQARFGDTVALLHSALGEGERYDEWRRLRTGEARIAVGPRSAVFAPVADLGLVVIDEEHDSSYKHEGDPRYDARLVAAERVRRAGGGARHAGGAGRHSGGDIGAAGGRTGARLLVGSATPRPETWHALPRLRLPDRVDARPLPPVRLLDMRGAQHPLHPETRRALAGARKSIVLLNRRGWSNFLTCRSCGKAWECPQCDVALVLHRSQNAVACHHCGHRERVPERCDVCGSLSVARHGAGTERIEHELREGLDVPVFRLDADTAGAKDAVPELLARFRAAPDGLLLGTQMVAKGHDFPDVTLGVVLDADSTLNFPDFRAEERTFALIAQLAGRAGRRAAGRARAGADQLPGRRRDRRRLPARRRGLPGRRARAPPRAPLPAVRGPDPDRLLRRGRRAGARRRGRGERRPGRAGAHRGARPRAAVPAARARALPGRGEDGRARAGRARDRRRGRGGRPRPRAPDRGLQRRRGPAVGAHRL